MGAIEGNSSIQPEVLISNHSMYIYIIVVYDVARGIYIKINLFTIKHSLANAHEGLNLIMWFSRIKLRWSVSLV